MKDYKITIIEECESTNDFLISKTKDGIAEGSSILSFKQTKGKGRNNKKWVSKPGNIFLSTVIKPLVNKRTWYQLSLLVGLSIYEALIEIGISKNNLRIKWPNDILINYRKVCGILIESFDDFVIIGIGLNVNSHPKKISSAIQATHLKFKQNLLIDDLKKISECILDRIYCNYKLWIDLSFNFFSSKINSKLAFLNENVLFLKDYQNKLGKLIGINEEGYLKILINDKEVKVLSSEVFSYKLEDDDVSCN